VKKSISSIHDGINSRPLIKTNYETMY